MQLWRGGRCDKDLNGEFDTKNDADVNTNVFIAFYLLHKRGNLECCAPPGLCSEVQSTQLW